MKVAELEVPAERKRVQPAGRAPQDLRAFLEALDREGQLMKIRDQVMPEPDVRGYMRAACNIPDTAPAIIFDNVKGYKGKRLVVNTHGSWPNCAVLFGQPAKSTVREQFYALADRWDSYPKGEVKWIKNAPCQENIVKGPINLYELLPLVRINQFDGGYYFSKASVITKDVQDPENFDTQNIGMYRIQVQAPDTLGMQALAFHDLGIHMRRAEELNKPLPVAICLGAPPVISFMACACIKYNQSEYKFASALGQAPLEVTKALTADLDIPAWSEYVLEGYVMPRVRYPEGPFGEFPGSYSGVRKQTRIKITSVTHRTDPIMETLYIGRPWTEHDCIDGISTCVTLYKQMKADMPEVTAVNALYQHGLTVIVAVHNKFGGYAKSAAFRLASTPHGISYAKNIIMVDGDVNPFDLTAVMASLSTRVRADKDVAVITHTPGMPLDPCSEPPGMGNKLIIDATTPAPPDAMMREVRMISPVPQAEAAGAQINKFLELAAGKV
jgi:vanillate/4-hydroxybenzoate decarboxylase subunit C